MQFASDNAGPVHPKIMEALAAANEGWAIGYGNDPLTERAIQRIKTGSAVPRDAAFSEHVKLYNAMGVILTKDKILRNAQKYPRGEE